MYGKNLGIFAVLIMRLGLFGGVAHAENDYIDRNVVEEKRIVVIIPSFNNKKWYQWNLDSVLSQRYENYRVIYIDDASTDGTGELVQEYLERSKQKHRVTFMRNYSNQGALYNLYHATHSCRDDEIMVTVDGDDALAHTEVLMRINNEYQNPRVWLTYGQYKIVSGGIGCSHQYTESVIQQRNFRRYDMVPSHLRTYYAWLFKKIKIEDLQINGKFFSASQDLALMWPMLEMAGDRFKFIPEVLYLYNFNNPLSHFRKNKPVQHNSSLIIKAKEKYPYLSNAD